MAALERGHKEMLPQQYDAEGLWESEESGAAQGLVRFAAIAKHSGLIDGPTTLSQEARGPKRRRPCKVTSIRSTAQREWCHRSAICCVRTFGPKLVGTLVLDATSRSIGLLRARQHPSRIF
jgi:hypothetical protein